VSEGEAKRCKIALAESGGPVYRQKGHEARDDPHQARGTRSRKGGEKKTSFINLRAAVEKRWEVKSFLD